MAEEKVDGLEGLDDFGDDFGEQLDSFMENDGEEESDSELDSFFEDLSTIDDLEGDDDSEPAEDKIEEEKTDDDEDGNVDVDDDEDDEDDDDEDAPLEDETKAETDDIPTAEPKKKKALSKKSIAFKPLIFSSITGLILGVITVVVLYYLATPTETALPEIVVEIPTEPVPIAKVSKPEPKKAKPKAKSKSISYYVQVVSCISLECVDNSRLKLKTLGYKSRVRTSSNSSGISEIISTKVLGEEYSARMVKIINNNNQLAGHAFRKSIKNGYLVSLGLFPDLETANRVRTYLNQAFKDTIFFNIQRTTQVIRFQAVQIAGLKSRKDAEKLRDKLRKNNPNFQSAFVKAVVKR